MIYKKAEEATLMSFLSGAADTVSEKVNLTEKPFQTIFATFGTSIAFSINPLLGLFVLGLEITGDTLSSWGSKIDDAFGFGKGKVANMPSEGQINSVAEELTNKSINKENEDSLINKAFGFFGLNDAKAMLSDLKEIKGEITENDVIVALSYAQNKNGLIKIAGIGGIFKWLFGFGKKSTAVKRSGIFGIVVWFLKKILQFLQGIGLLAAGGGIAAYTGYKKETEGNVPTSQVNEKTTLYKNTKGNVKNTIIDFLNSEYNFNHEGKLISFSDMYKQKNKTPIENSPEMNELLFKIQLANGAKDLNEISNWESFKGPNLKSMFDEFFATPPVEDQKPQPTNISKLSKRDKSLEEISDLMKSMKG